MRIDRLLALADSDERQPLSQEGFIMRPVIASSRFVTPVSLRRVFNETELHLSGVYILQVALLKVTPHYAGRGLTPLRSNID